MSDTSLALYEHQGMELCISRAPETVLAEASKVASALKDVVMKTNAVVKLGKSLHLKCEAWQTLGHFYGLTARISGTRFVQFGEVSGFEATAELIHVQSQKVISVAEAMCLNDEERWKTRAKYEEGADGKRHKVGDEAVPLFQLRSMAQTRAISKVHSNALRWVVVLAGYNPTPAEEVEGQNLGDDIQQPRRASDGKAGQKISEAQRKRLYALSKEYGKSEEYVKSVLKEHGFESSADITRDRYEQICARVQQGV